MSRDLVTTGDEITNRQSDLRQNIKDKEDRKIRGVKKGSTSQLKPRSNKREKVTGPAQHSQSTIHEPVGENTTIDQYFVSSKPLRDQHCDIRDKVVESSRRKPFKKQVAILDVIGLSRVVIRPGYMFPVRKMIAQSVTEQTSSSQDCNRPFETMSSLTNRLYDVVTEFDNIIEINFGFVIAIEDKTEASCQPACRNDEDVSNPSGSISWPPAALLLGSNSETLKIAVISRPDGFLNHSVLDVVSFPSLAKERYTLDQLYGPVYDASALNRPSTFVTSDTSEGNVKVWELVSNASGRKKKPVSELKFRAIPPVSVLNGRREYQVQLPMSTFGQSIAYVEGGYLCVWNEGTREHEFITHLSENIISLCLNETIVAGATNHIDASLFSFNRQTGRRVSTYQRKQHPSCTDSALNAIRPQLSSNERFLFASNGLEVDVFDLDGLQLIYTIPPPMIEDSHSQILISSFVLVRDSSELIVALTNGDLVIYEFSGQPKSREVEYFERDESAQSWRRNLADSEKHSLTDTSFRNWMLQTMLSDHMVDEMRDIVPCWIGYSAKVAVESGSVEYAWEERIALI
ncbi:hypothetical protein BJ742DRAFT_902743 [Cladochytrium replicatum]|nr:hypothetical protein BJ742DRAFT_902743 [Cladochytrium replicatum]